MLNIINNYTGLNHYIQFTMPTLLLMMEYSALIRSLFLNGTEPEICQCEDHVPGHIFPCISDTYNVRSVPPTTAPVAPTNFPVLPPPPPPLPPPPPPPEF